MASYQAVILAAGRVGNRDQDGARPKLDFCNLRAADRSDRPNLRIVGKADLSEGNLKGCGFYGLQSTVFDSVARTPRTALRDEYELTLSLDLHVKSGHPMYARSPSFGSATLHALRTC